MLTLTTTPVASPTPAPAAVPAEAGVPGEAQKPPRPIVTPELKEWTQGWIARTGESPASKAMLEQYKQDLQTLFPDMHQKAMGQVSGKGGKARPRKENRDVAVPRVYQFSLQTLALLCPGDLSFRIEGRDEIPPMGSMPTTAGQRSRDQYLDQFARTLDDRLARHFEDCEMVPVLRDFARHCIWFQAGVLKMSYQREFADSGMVHNRLPDGQDDLARFQYLMLCYLRGDFTRNDADFIELQNLKEAIGDSHEVEVWQNLIGENVPLNRFFCDDDVQSLAGMRNAQYMGDKFTMTGEQILTTWPFKDLGNGKWEGVHPDDLGECDTYDSDGSKVLVEEAKKRKERKGNSQLATTTGSATGKQDVRKQIFLVREVWAACEGNRVFWLIDGLDYPARSWRPKRQHRWWYPYFVHALNPQPGTWLGRSDTQNQGPVQDRINRKKSDQEIARWMSTGGRGVADTSQVDGSVIDSIRNLSPGEFLKANMQGLDINKALMWLEVPYHAEAFNFTDDEADERLTHRLPAAALGVTDARTTATAINTANAGSQIAFNDRQTEFNQVLARVITSAGDLVVLEDRHEDVLRESGPNALWPRVYKESDAKRIVAEIERRVNEVVTNEMHAELIQARMSGQPIEMDPQAMQDRIDQRIIALTEQECLRAFGYPEPLTREGLFKRLQIKVNVSMNAAIDRERRIMSITNLLQQVIGLGLPINPEPIARLLTSLMGEGDQFGDLFKPDPNALVQMLAQIAQVDPARLTPESVATVAKLGQLAQAYLMQMQQQQAGAGGGAGKPAAGAESPAGGAEETAPALPAPVA